MKHMAGYLPIVTLCAAALCTAPLCTALAASAQTEVISAAPFMGRGLTVQAVVGGKPGTFLFDTGGGVSNVTPAFAAAIGCTPWGQISGYTMTGQRLDMKRCDHVAVKLGKSTFALETVGVFDGTAMMPPGAPHLDGTIALDTFAGRALLLSYTQRQITVLDDRGLGSATAGRTALPLHLVRDAEGVALSVNLPVSTPLGVAWFEMDSGNTSPWLLVGKHLASVLQLRPDDREAQPLHLTLSDGSKVAGMTRVLDLTLDGNLGTAFLSSYDVVLDLAHAKAWVKPAAAANATNCVPSAPA